MDAIRQYRTIWISDVHLGTKGCKAEFLLDFLRHTESRYLYLVGDIVDGWQIKKSWFWIQSHNDVIQKLLRKARKGTQVTYVPGNHDEAMRGFTGLRFGGISVERQAIHVMTDGRRFLVMHGDELDTVTANARWLAEVGHTAYGVALVVNRWFNWCRRKLGYRYWSLSAYLKQRVKNAVGHASGFPAAVAQVALREHVEGVVCGHIHKAELLSIDGIQYCNCGDWVESCTALVEHLDGRLELLNWAEIRQQDLLAVPV